MAGESMGHESLESAEPSCHEHTDKKDGLGGPREESVRREMTEKPIERNLESRRVCGFWGCSLRMVLLMEARKSLPLQDPYIPTYLVNICM